MFFERAKLFVKSVLFIFCIFSCSTHNIEREQMSLIKEAKDLLYKNMIDDATHILNKIDTILLDEKGLATFRLSKSFLCHLNGDRKGSFEHMLRASLFFDRYGAPEEKAEVFLINGFNLERALLNTEASENYLNALEIYLAEGGSDLYFITLLGVIRTTFDGKSFLKEAEEYLERNWTKHNQVLYLTTKAAISTDFKKKLALKTEALKYFDEEDAIRKHISLLTNIASNYETLGRSDSAYYYLKKSENIINENSISESHQLHYYLVKAYIESKHKRFEDALESIDFILKYSSGRSGILSNAYSQRAYIYTHTGDPYAANQDLKNYIKYLKQEHHEHQKHRIGLLSIQMQMQLQKLELEEVKTGWLITCVFFLLIAMLVWLAFFYHKRRSAIYKQELKDERELANNRLIELIESRISIVNEESNSEEKHSKIQGRNLADMQGHEFSIFFNIEYPRFREKMILAHPEMTNTDLKYCEGVLAHQTVKQTAILFDVSSNAVKKARQRLRAMLKCESTKDLALYIKKVNEIPLERN